MGMIDSTDVTIAYSCAVAPAIAAKNRTRKAAVVFMMFDIVGVKIMRCMNVDAIENEMQDRRMTV
jgi:hypothetical protein